MAAPPLIPHRFREAVEWGVQQFLALRPRFYNGITWTLVVSGTLLMASPLWEQLIAAALERSFDLRITGGGNDTAWGFSLVVCGLLYQLAMHAMTQRQELRQLAHNEHARAEYNAHDRAVFERMQTTTNERTLLDLLNHLACNHGAVLKRLRKLDDLVDFLAQPENQFIAPELRNQANALLRSLHRMQAFVGRHFFSLRGRSPEDGLFLYPDFNIDRGGSGDPEQIARYNDFADQMHQLIIDAEREYMAFRDVVKHTLAL